MSRFSELSSKIQKKRGYPKDRADAIAAAVGREKYGKDRFQAMAAAGRRKKRRKGRAMGA